MSIMKFKEGPLEFKTPEQYLLYRIGVLEQEVQDLKAELARKHMWLEVGATLGNLADEIKKETKED